MMKRRESSGQPGNEIGSVVLAAFALTGIPDSNGIDFEIGDGFDLLLDHLGKLLGDKEQRSLIRSTGGTYDICKTLGFALKGS